MHFTKTYLYIIMASAIVVTANHSYAQMGDTIIRKGQIYGDLFLNANQNFDNGQTSFRLNRLHFAYKYNFNNNLYFNGMIETARENYDPDNDYNGITNLFEFCVGFNYEKISGKFGLIGTQLNQQQEKLWQHRYIDKVFADKYQLSPTNDFGFIIIYNPIEIVQVDLTVVNGEGHKNWQKDSTLRYSLGVSVNPLSNFVVRAFSDMQLFEGFEQINVIGILGYQNELVSIGTEWNHQIHSNRTIGYRRNGMSAYASVNITSKYQLFGRYDFIESNQPYDMPQPWNITNDGSLTIAGLQYNLTPVVNIALDYRGWRTMEDNKLHSYIFLDTQLIFK